jgi:YidC/Oxa1 family membrane protein insertase
VNLNYLYYGVSWIMLRWHDVFSFLENGTFLGTNWDWVLAIIFLVITVRIILFPLFVKQIKSQRAMQAIQPQLKELQAKHKGDRETLQKEMMELYKKEKANPLMGCLPIFLQVPVFISLFWILGRRMDPNRPLIVKAQGGDPPDPAVVEASNIELYTWTFDQYESAANAMLFNAPIAATMFEVGWFERDMVGLYPQMGTSALNVGIVAGILTILMVITTFLTTRQMILKTGWATDPQQLMIQKLMVYGLPLMLLVSGAFFPIAVIVYWVTNNLFSLGQQQWVLRKYPPPPTASATGGGPKPAGGKPSSGRTTDGKATDRPAVDGKKLAPKPGAKPVKPAAGAKPVKNVPPKRAPAKNVPPKRKSSTPKKT